MTRRQIREQIFLLLFSAEFYSRDELDEQLSINIGKLKSLAEQSESISGGDEDAEPSESISGGDEDAEPSESISGGDEDAEPSESISGGDEDAEPSESISGGDEDAEPAESISAGDEDAEPTGSISDKDMAYIEGKVRDIIRRLDVIDAQINAGAENWKTTRMGKTELAIIRLAFYEMRYEEDIPVSVAINEAVELAKVYGSERGAAFVNGVLAKLT